MHKTSKTSQSGGWWKIGVVIVLFGYTLSTVLAFDTWYANALPSSSSLAYSLDTKKMDTWTQISPSFQRQIETEVALGAQSMWNSLVNFMQQGLKADSKTEFTFQPTSSGQAEASQVSPSAILSVVPQSDALSLPAFEDISTDSNKVSIDILASIGVFTVGENKKFYPHNHVRCSDFIRVMVDVYRYKLGYPVAGTKGLLDNSYFDPINKDALLIKKLNTAQALGLLKNMENLKLDAMITPLQAKQIFNNMLDLNPYIGQKEQLNQIITSRSLMSKSEMAGYIATVFQLEKKVDTPFFVDISNHKYQDSITKLAQLGVVVGDNGYFHPDNLVLRSDAVMMIAKSLLVSKGISHLSADLLHINTINDTTYFAPFASYLEYLLANEVGNSLLYPQQSGYLFLPYAQLTKWEAYILLSQATRVKLLNIDPWESAKPITRWELASLIVEVFDFFDRNPQVAASVGSWFMLPSANPYAARREENKGILIAFLKDILDTL